jgi:hypothetical protein
MVLGYPSPWQLPLNELSSILRIAGSAYELMTEGSPQLARRVDAAAKAAMASAVDAAWVAAYGLEPDPNLAYREAVLAVEAVAIPMMCSAANNPTLGTVLSALRGAVQASSPAWQLGLPAQDGTPAKLDAVAQLVELLWHGQRSRHAGGASSRANTQSEGEHAVMVAVLLVHWFTKHGIQKV